MKCPERVPKSFRNLLRRSSSARMCSRSRKELRTTGGAIVPLRSQSAELLAVLAARAGEVVPKSELMKAVWADIAVTDDSMVQCVADIRRALGDEQHNVVQTFPKKGYRLNVDGQITPGPVAVRRASVRPRLPRLLALAAVLVLAVVIVAGQQAFRTVPAGSDDMPRIAVLPFDDFSSGDDKGYLSDAISEGIITELARSKTYSVIARNSSFRYRDKPTDVPRIGEELGVDYVPRGQPAEGRRAPEGDRSAHRRE